MTLLEKFEKVNNTFWLRNELELIKVADEFAIGFAEWCQYRCVQKEDLKSQLEIYKKVKGL